MTHAGERLRRASDANHRSTLCRNRDTLHKFRLARLSHCAESRVEPSSESYSARASSQTLRPSTWRTFPTSPMGDSTRSFVVVYTFNALDSKRAGKVRLKPDGEDFRE